MLSRFLAPSNRSVRVVVGLFLAALFCIQCVSYPDRDAEVSRTVLTRTAVADDRAAAADGQDVLELARNDHIALLERCLQQYDRHIHDYTATLIKQERIGGRLQPPQHANVKFLQNPFSVALHFVRNAPLGERVLYVSGRYDGNMLVRPRGWMGGVFGTVQRRPDDPEAMKASLQPISSFGLRNMLQTLLDVYRAADAAGDLGQEFGGYAEVGGRQTLALIRHLPPRDGYPAARTITYIDPEYMLPLMLEGYDWDGEFILRHAFHDLAFNTGLTEADFLPSANNMTDPD